MTSYECRFCQEAYFTNEVRLKHEEICAENDSTPEERAKAKLQQAKDKAAAEK